MNSAPPRERLAPLTALRFVAAFRIAMYHFTHGEPPAGWLAGLMGTPVGASFFFVCSGFALTYVYAHQFAEGTFSRRRFYAARCARILPVYALALVVALPIMLSRGIRRGTEPQLPRSMTSTPGPGS